jgi:uncharacterized SAM-binding protein YcdF (DUF218 family)
MLHAPAIAIGQFGGASHGFFLMGTGLRVVDLTENPSPDDAVVPSKSHIGPDGFAVLATSFAIMALSLGTTLLPGLAFVLWVAARASCVSPPRRRILVLGMRLDPSGQLTLDYRARLLRAAALWSEMKSARIVILGGRPSPLLPSEAQMGRTALQAAGVPAANLILEEQSHHTLENLLHYRAAFADSRLEPVLLVTNRFHLARCALLAAGLGIPHQLCAAEDQRMPPIRHASRLLFEALLIHWYITGRILTALLGNRHLAARIR